MGMKSIAMDAIAWGNPCNNAGARMPPLFSLPGHHSLVVRSRFSPDGKYLATASLDSTVRIYVVPSDDLLILARSRLTRSLKPEKCQKYLHQETCP
jgi:WD40 repeat protein